MKAARTTSRRQEARHQHLQDQHHLGPHDPQADGARSEHAEDDAGADPHHPQRTRRSAGTPENRERSRLDCPDAARERKSPPDGRRQPSRGQRCDAARPPAGALRPLARALLSVAAEMHAARCEARRISCPEHERTLRMPEDRGRLPVRLPLRVGLASPATHERTGCADASSHVEAAPTPPVKNSDCIGDCA